MRSNSSLHAVTWVIWAVAAAVTVHLAPNPVYVGLVVGLAAVVVEANREQAPMARAFPVLVGVGVAFGVLRVVLTALTTQAPDRVLVTLPEVTLPRLLGGLTFGGAISLDVIARTAAEAVVLVGILAAFGAFNAVVSHAQLLDAAPRAFRELGLVMAVAISLVPATITAIQDAREADRARTGGRVVRRGRVPRQLLPVLETGLERAVHLAESMDSRGFGRVTAAKRADEATAWATLAAMAVLFGAFVSLIARQPALSGVLALAGAGLVGVAIVAGSVGRRPYRRERPSRVDAIVVIFAIGCPTALWILDRIGVDSLAWDASGAPPVDVAVVACLVALVAPAVAGQALRRRILGRQTAELTQ